MIRIVQDTDIAGDSWFHHRFDISRGCEVYRILLMPAQKSDFSLLGIHIAIPHPITVPKYGDGDLAFAFKLDDTYLRPKKMGHQRLQTIICGKRFRIAFDDDSLEACRVALTVLPQRSLIDIPCPPLAPRIPHPLYRTLPRIARKQIPYQLPKNVIHFIPPYVEEIDSCIV